MSKELLNEEWKVIDNFSNYSVSNYGRIKNNKTSYILKNHLLKQKGYMYIFLRSDSGKYYNLQVHRLVGKAFIPNPLNKPQINHIDYDKTNNYVGNLEWVSSLENTRYSLERTILARIGIKRTDKARLNISKGHLKKDRELGHHIYKNHYHFSFSFQFKGNKVHKTFKTYNEALAYRDKYLEEIGYEC